MPARTRRFSRRSTGRNRRRTIWATADVNATVTANAAWINIDLLANYKSMLGSSIAGVTVLRTILSMWATGTVANGDGVRVGLIVDDLDQVTASQTTVATVVNPHDDPYTAWMMIEQRNAHPHYSFEGAVDGWHYDIRSKRRIHDIGQTLIWSVYNQDVAAPSFPFAIYARTLLALP